MRASSAAPHLLPLRLGEIPGRVRGGLQSALYILLDLLRLVLVLQAERLVLGKLQGGGRGAERVPGLVPIGKRGPPAGGGCDGPSPRNPAAWSITVAAVMIANETPPGSLAGGLPPKRSEGGGRQMETPIRGGSPPALPIALREKRLVTLICLSTRRFSDLRSFGGIVLLATACLGGLPRLPRSWGLWLVGSTGCARWRKARQSTEWSGEGKLGLPLRCGPVRPTSGPPSGRSGGLEGSSPRPGCPHPRAEPDSAQGSDPLRASYHRSRTTMSAFTALVSPPAGPPGPNRADADATEPRWDFIAYHRRILCETRRTAPHTVLPVPTAPPRRGRLPGTVALALLRGFGGASAPWVVGLWLPMLIMSHDRNVTAVNAPNVPPGRAGAVPSSLSLNHPRPRFTGRRPAPPPWRPPLASPACGAAS